MKISKRIAWAVCAAASGMPFASHATNGYFDIGYGASAQGMGGAAAAFPQDSLCTATNPACLTSFSRMRMDAGVALFSPRRHSGQAGLGPRSIWSNTWSGANEFLIPAMGVVFPYSDKLALGFAAYGNGGMNTLYKPNFFNLFGTSTDYLGVDLVQLFVPITASYKLNDSHSIGVAIIPARQRFLAQGLQAFAGFSSDPVYVTNKGHAYANGIGARIGWLGKFADNRVSVGASYASRVYMQKFDKYKGLFAEQGGFDVPANAVIGVAVKVLPALTAAFDVQRIWYSDVASVGNLGPSSLDPAGAVNLNPLGSNNGMGFGWQDQTVYKLGVSYDYNKNLTLRTGFNYGKSPIPDSQMLFNLLAPGIVEKHLTLGFTYKISDDDALTFAYQHAFKRKQAANVYFGGFGPIAVEGEMYQDIYNLAYSLQF